MFTLKESTNKYEKFHRQKQITMTFAEFNAKYGTCLPENEVVQRTFLSNLSKAKKSEGIPVTRRLYSIYHGLTTQSGQRTSKIIATPPPAPQIDHKPPLPSVIADGSFEHNIRSPTLDDVMALCSTFDDPIEKYQSLLQKEDAKFFDKRGLMVHFVETDGVPLLGNTCKLNKSNASALYTQNGTLTMRNQSTIEMDQLNVDEEDHQKFMQMRQEKIKGPYFLRVNK